MKVLQSISFVTAGLLAVFLLTIPYKASAQMETPIFKMVLKGDAGDLKAAAKNGEDLNQQTRLGNTLLMVAAKLGDREVINVLLSYGVDVDAQNQAGATALMMAAKYGHPHFVALLLEKGANPTLQTKRGYRASTFARGYKHYDIHDQLVEAEIRFKKNASTQSLAGS